MAIVQLPTGEKINMPDNPTTQDLSDFDDVMKISTRRAVAQTPEAAGGPMGFANGLAELAGKGLLSIPYMAGKGVNDAVDMAHGRPEGATPDGSILKSLHPDLSDNAIQVAHSIGGTKAGQTAQDIYHAAQTAEPDLTRAATDITSILPAADVARAGAGIVGDVAQSVGKSVGNAIGKGAGLTEEGAQTAGGASIPAGMAPQEQTVARRIANDKTVTQQATQTNQAVGNAKAGAVVGTNLGDAEAPSRVIAARAPANQVYNRIGNQLPTAALTDDADTATAIGAAGADGARIKGSPNSRAMIADDKANLLDGKPMTGPELIDTQRSLRSDGHAMRASEDPDMQHLGQAKIDMANALDDHIQRNLPEGSDVTPEQFTGARTALAQSHTVQSLLTPSGNLDMHALAQLHLDNPKLLTGDLRDIANFAGENPLVTKAADSILPADAIKDAKNSASIVHPAASLLNGLGGSTIARRMLGAGEQTADRVAQINPLPPQPLGRGTFDANRDQIFAKAPGQVGPPIQRELDMGAPPGPAAPPVGLSVGEGAASPTGSLVKSGPSNYSSLADELAPVGLDVGEGKASPTASPARSGPSGLGDDLAPVGLSVGEGAASPKNLKAKTSGTAPPDEGLSVGEGKAGKRRGK